MNLSLQILSLPEVTWVDHKHVFPWALVWVQPMGAQHEIKGRGRRGEQLIPQACSLQGPLKQAMPLTGGHHPLTRTPFFHVPQVLHPASLSGATNRRQLPCPVWSLYTQLHS